MEKIDISTFYFQLDCGWISDPKIQVLIDDLGCVGLGIYVTTVSWLYLEKGVLSKKHYKYIASQIHCDEKLIKNVVEDYDLFYFEENEFSSKRAREDMNRRLKMSKGGSKTKIKL